MSKPVRNAVAVILRNKSSPKEFLVVKRPNEDGDLDGYWGLPAVRMQQGELPEDAARRACRQKLGCDAVPVSMPGTMFQKRSSYEMYFIDIEMLLVGEVQPDVALARTEGTAYIDQQWTTDPTLLLPAARAGSCCSTIFLTSQGLLNRDDWVTSLEGSEIVR